MFLIIRRHSLYFMGDESSDVLESCPKGEKSSYQSFFSIFSSDMPVTVPLFNSLCLSDKITKNSNSCHFLSIFLFLFLTPPTSAGRQILFVFLSPATTNKNPCRDPSPIKYSKCGLNVSLFVAVHTGCD